MQSREILPNGLTLFQDDRCFKLGQDSVLLSAFARIPHRAHVLDLGCGTGALALLCWRADLTITGLELQSQPVALFARAIAHNALHNVSVMQGDLRNIRQLIPHGSMRFVLCNPPYFMADSGKQALDSSMRTARQDETATLNDIVDAMAWVLPTGGQCALVFRPERLCSLLDALQARGLTPKRMRFVHQTATSAPSAVLVSAKRGAAHGVIVEPPLLVCNPDGTQSAEYRSIYGKEV